MPRLGLGLGLKGGVIPSTKTISYYLSQSILGLDPSVPASLRDSADNEAGFLDTIAEWQNQGTGASDATQATALNQPTLINEQGLYSPGVVGNGASVPNEEAFDSTGDIDVSVSFAVPYRDLNLPSNSPLIAKNDFRYILRSTGGGSRISFYWGSVGGAVNESSTVDVPTSSLSVRATLDVDNGSGAYEIKFYVSDLKDPSLGDWVQLGATITGANTTDVLTSASTVNIGYYGSFASAAPFTKGQIREGIDGPLALDVDFTDTAIPHGATSFTASTGQTVTINQSGDNPARIIKYHEVYFDGLNNRMDFTWNQPTGDYWFVSSSDRGVLYGEISLTNGQTYSFDGIGLVRSDNWQYGGLKMGLAIFDPAITAADKTKLISLAEGKSANPTWAGETDFYQIFRNGELVSFPLIDTSSVTNFYAAWRDNNLTSFPLINTSSGTDFNRAWFGNNLTSFPLIDTSSGTNFTYAWYGNNLTSFPLIDTSSGTNFDRAWRFNNLLTSFPSAFFDAWNPSSVVSGVFDETWDGCNSLTAQSVENILVSLDASGIYGTNTGLVGGTTLADNTIDIDSDGSALTGAATTAITNLKSKDWQISYNGVLQ